MLPKSLKERFASRRSLSQGPGVTPPSLPSLLHSSFCLVPYTRPAVVVLRPWFVRQGVTKAPKSLSAHLWVENWVPQPLGQQWTEYHLPGLLSHHWEISSWSSPSGKGCELQTPVRSSLQQSPQLWGYSLYRLGNLMPESLF